MEFVGTDTKKNNETEAKIKNEHPTLHWHYVPYYETSKFQSGKI
jgi:hypothetical protein